MRPANTIRPEVVKGSPWINPQEAAAYVGVSVDTIYTACQTGALRYSKLGHSTVRIKREWVDAWVQSMERV